MSLLKKYPRRTPHRREITAHKQTENYLRPQRCHSQPAEFCHNLADMAGLFAARFPTYASTVKSKIPAAYTARAFVVALPASSR